MKSGLFSAHAEAYLDYLYTQAAHTVCHTATERYLLTAG
jgi:hypothetical protein